MFTTIKYFIIFLTNCEEIAVALYSNSDPESQHTNQSELNLKKLTQVYIRWDGETKRKGYFLQVYCIHVKYITMLMRGICL